MIRTKLMKAFALGLCMSTLYTGVAFAQSGAGFSPSFGGQVEAQDHALFEKQREMDQYLFVDHVKEIEKKGFKVIYTGVADSYVEVGITPYSDENADYLYEIFGKDNVKVVATEEAVIYAATDEAAASDKDEPVSATVVMAPDAPVSDKEAAAEKKMADNGEEFSIQIESVEEGNLENPEVIFQTTVAEDAREDAAEAQDDTEVQLVSATDANAQVVSAKDENKSEGLSAPMTILLIAGGAAVIGGAVVASNKKKTEK